MNVVTDVIEYVRRSTLMITNLNTAHKRNGKSDYITPSRMTLLLQLRPYANYAFLCIQPAPDLSTNPPGLHYALESVIFMASKVAAAIVKRLHNVNKCLHCIVVNHVSLKGVRKACHVKVCGGGGLLKLLEAIMHGIILHMITAVVLWCINRSRNNRKQSNIYKFLEQEINNSYLPPHSIGHRQGFR